MQKKIYLSGSVNGTYRAQNIIKSLGDCNINYFKFSGYNILPNVKISRPVRLLVNISWQILLLIAKVPALLSCTHVIVLPMNYSIITLLDVLLARGFGKKVIVDYYIGLYDTYVNDRKTVSSSSYSAKWYKFKDRFLLKLATKVIFLNKAEADFYQRIAEVTIPKERCCIIPLCIDYRKEMFVKANSKPETTDFNVCWWGTYIPLHGLEKVIDAFKFIDDNNIKLHIFGNSDAAASPYQKRINDYGLQDRIFIKNDVTFSNGRLGEFLINSCDIAIGNFGNSEKAKTVLVNKLVDAISLNIPCLTQPTLATNEFFKDGEALKYCEATPEAIAKQILELRDDPVQLNKIKNKAQTQYLELFSPDVFRSKLLEIL